MSRSEPDVTARSDKHRADDSSSSSTYTAKIRLRSSEFRKKREEGWRDLEAFITKAEKRGIKALPAADLQRLPVLYRSALSSLSVARSIAQDRNLLTYLENLTLRSFIVVYGPRSSLFRAIGQFFARDFPRAVRAGGWHILIAFAALMVGTIAGFALVMIDQSWFDSFVPGWIAHSRGPDASVEVLRESIFPEKFPGFAETFGAFASFLFLHNSTVGVLTLVLGFAVGIPSVLLTIQQGTMLGAMIAAFHMHGLTVDFIGWLSIHGVTELSAIVLCCAGGLMIGEKMLFPGRYSRMDAVRRNGHLAAQVVIGAIFMLLIAGILEGGFRQLITDTPTRYAIGGASGLVWLSYFLFSGRRGAHR